MTGADVEFVLAVIGGIVVARYAIVIGAYAA